jgi:hypothetical protein
MKGREERLAAQDYVYVCAEWGKRGMYSSAKILCDFGALFGTVNVHIHSSMAIQLSRKKKSFEQINTHSGTRSREYQKRVGEMTSYTPAGDGMLPDKCSLR